MSISDYSPEELERLHANVEYWTKSYIYAGGSRLSTQQLSKQMLYNLYSDALKYHAIKIDTPSPTLGAGVRFFCKTWEHTANFAKSIAANNHKADLSITRVGDGYEIMISEDSTNQLKLFA